MSSLVVFQHSCRTPAMQCCCSPGPCLAALLPWLACFAMACMAFSYSDVFLGWHMYFSDFTKTKMQDDFLLSPPPPPHNLPLNPRHPINLLERPKYVGEQKTRLASQADCYGYTYGRNNFQKSMVFVKYAKYGPLLNFEEQIHKYQICQIR